VSERIAEAFWIAVLLVCVFSVDQFLAAQPVSDEQKENDICSQQSKYYYEDKANGERHFVPYAVINGQDVVEGDIVIGRSDGPGFFPPVVPDYIDGQRTRWGNGVAPYVVPFVIDSSAEAYRSWIIRDAMSAWSSQNKSIIFVERKEKTDWRKENYIKFISGPTDENHWVCQSNSIGVKKKVDEKKVGVSKEEENINVVQVAGCGSWGSIAHEIGHVLGLGHEQSRKDRGDYITMLWGNIKDGPSDDINKYRKQYCRVIWDQQTLANTDYDFDSIMHYPVDGFSKDPRDKSCEKVEDYNGKRCLAFDPKPEKAPLWPKSPNIGQRYHLSKGDIEAVNTLYPAIRPTEPPPLPVPSCVIVTKTTVRVGDQTTETTKTEPCTSGGRPIPGDQQCCQERRCCHEKKVVARPCYPDGCRPPVKVNWPRPDRWCRSEWCRPWPRPRPLCEREGWIEDRPPFDDWDDRS
jgi:Astacin (Peptidase family M12A)